MKRIVKPESIEQVNAASSERAATPQVADADGPEGIQPAAPDEAVAEAAASGEPESNPKHRPETLGDDLSDMTLADMMLPTNFDQIAGSLEFLATIPIRKPGGQEWIRVHEKHYGRFYFFELKREGSSGEMYYVHPALCGVPELRAELEPRELRLAVNRKGGSFLWAVPLTDHPAHQQQQFAALKATECWVRIRWDKPAFTYRIDVPKAQDLPEPAWPRETFEELCKLAFRARMIDSLEHPVVRELLGRG